jgi:NTP pyrophosphatase (non-canonical NTP hydrolase)
VSRRFYPPTGRGKLYVDVHRERIRAHEKHDPKGHSMERRSFTDPVWLPVLTEEVGEVARVLCETELDAELMRLPEAKKHLREELVQVAAMACSWIDAIDLDQQENE